MTTDTREGLLSIADDNKRLMAYIQAGIPATSIRDVVDAGFRRGDVLAAVGAASTLERKMRQEQKLDLAESDRLADVARIYRLAVKVFGSREKAVHWLNRPIRGVGREGESALRTLNTSAGSREVENRLNQIAYGVFA